MEQRDPPGLAMDDKSFSDNNDMLEEMRLTLLLHSRDWPPLESDSPSPQDIFRMATFDGAYLLGFSDHVGQLSPGMKAYVSRIDSAFEMMFATRLK